jgi:hypothetical protein
MVRLLKACFQGGNDKAAMLFVGASSMIGVEECCQALLAHCPQIPAPAPFAQSNVPPVFTGLGDEDGGEETKSCVESSASIMNGDRILKMLAPHSRLVASAETIEDQPLSHAVKKDQAKKSKEQKKRVSSVLRNFSFSSSADRPSISFFGANKSSQKSEQSDQEAIDLKTAEKTMQVKVGVATLTVSECFEDGSLIERGAFEVLALLVELVDLLPLSASQLRSPLLWECVSTVCLPAVDELALRREFGVENDDVEGSQGSDLSHLTCERIVCAELVDLMDCLLTRIDHHNLVEGAAFTFSNFVIFSWFLYFDISAIVVVFQLNFLSRWVGVSFGIMKICLLSSIATVHLWWMIFVATSKLLPRNTKACQM